MEGLKAVAACQEADMVISAIAGTMGLQPTIEAILAGKEIGLANKEVLVSAGALVMRLVKEKGIQLIPIDSEHSAIFQCLNGEKKEAIHRIILFPEKIFGLEILKPFRCAGHLHAGNAKGQIGFGLRF